MSQRQLGGGRTSVSESEEGDTCGEAVMAAMQAISDHCGSDEVPLEMSNGMVTMVPREEMDQIQNMAPGEMTDEELFDMMEESPWLGEWVEGICRAAGHVGGTDQYDECRLRFARKALD